MFESQSGQVLVLTLMLTSVGALATGVMLGVVNGTSRASGAFRDSTETYYAASSAIEAVMADLLEGVDALPVSGDTPYVKPVVEVNSFPVTLTISAPTVAEPPRAVYRYVDPDAGGALASLAAGATYTSKLHGSGALQQRASKLGLCRRERARRADKGVGLWRTRGGQECQAHTGTSRPAWRAASVVGTPTPSSSRTWGQSPSRPGISGPKGDRTIPGSW